MSNPQVIFETKLARLGRKLIVTGIGLFAVWIGLRLVFDVLFMSGYGWGFLAIGAFASGYLINKGFQLRRNPGVYRIHIDDYGIYVLCDAAAFAPSFSVIATDLKCLVRRIIDGDLDKLEYYIETKSGKRHQIADVLMYADVEKINCMKVFDKITDRFTWLEIVEEVA